ncbi:MAG: LptE family protein [Candidatus Zixiibacteriota bacterium]|jgi:outer membrane lipopolysaccharide assembly protein LptE/RlpB
MRKAASASLAFVIILTATLACGPYTFNPNLPGHIKSVAIPLFKNPRTFKYGAERVLTDAVINEFVADGSLDVAGENVADSKLTVEIVNYKKEALSYDVQEVVKEYNLAVVISATFTDLTTNQVLWQEPSLYESVSYYAVGGRAETEDEALDRLAEELARKIVNRTLQGW